MNKEQMWEILEDMVGVYSETLQIISNINGYSEETMEDVLYAVTGYNTFEQYLEEEGK